MGLTSLVFTKSEKWWVSDEYVPGASNIAVGVKFKSQPGAAIVERSIDGVNWVAAGAIATATNDSMYVLQNVFGFVIGEGFRVITTGEPESINILE